MNSRQISLGLLAVNLALLGVVGYLAYSLKFGPAPAAEAAKGKVVTNTVTQISVRKVNATNLLAALNRSPFTWNGIESTNYPTYIANLRAIGCPEETVRDIIITDVAKLYARRRAALRTQGQPYKFWQTGDGTDGSANPELQNQLRALEKEERGLVKTLLGVDLQTELAKYSEGDDAQERMYGFLPAEKREKLQTLQASFDDLEQAVYDRSRGVMLDEDQEELRRIQKQKEAAMAKILTPEEWEEFNLRNSSTANNLRGQMSGFAPTEEEFRKIFRLQKTFDSDFNQGFDATDDKQMEIKARAQDEAQNALNDEIKKVLGDPRNAEYQRAQSGDYRTLVQMAERFELPAEVAGKVYDMKQEVERQVQKVDANPNLTDEQRQKVLAAIGLETERSVAQAMGDKAFQAYRKTGPLWLQGLINAAASPPPAPPPTLALPPVQ